MKKMQKVLWFVCMWAIAVSMWWNVMAYESWCWDKTSTSKIHSHEYRWNNATPKNYKRTDTQKVQRIKNIMWSLSQNQLIRFERRLQSYANNLWSNHPKYSIVVMLLDYVRELQTNNNVWNSTITDIVVNTPDVSILKDIVVALDLADTLASDGPFTVFAPTNEAFENLLDTLDMTFEELASDTDLLETVVLYHVLGSEVKAKDVLSLTEGTLVPTIWWESLRVSNRNGVFVDTSEVIKTDIDASNGVIHLIDEVLLPPSVREDLWLPTDRWDENIVQTAIDNGSFPTLVTAIQAAWLVDALWETWPFTVYAPTEQAFVNLLNDLGITAEELLADTTLLTDVLTYHVVPWFYTAEDIVWLSRPVQAPTLQGTSLRVDPHNGNPKVNNSNIILTDVFASNGVIHVIDEVLIP